MRLTTRMTSIMLAVAALGFTGFASEAGAADVYLKAEPFTQTAQGSSQMWGFASCDDTFTVCGAATAPGPQIDAVAGEILNIHVQNTLQIPVSITIPGQTTEVGRVPVMMGTVPDRVQSFTHETAAGAEGTYTWGNLAEGTYLYQSGTFPSLQVPMGLYGALVVSNATAGIAYDDYAFAGETVLLFSEIDPVQNARVHAAAATGDLPGIACEQDQTQPGYPCAVDYSPMYFLVNGGDTTPPAVGDPTAESVQLLRFLNAGLRSHTPSIVSVELGLIAEDGNAYRGLPLRQSAALLAAGKTLDALVTLPPGDQTYSLFDRMPTFSNESLPNGGSLVSMNVGDGTLVIDPPASLAVDDAYSVPEDCGSDPSCATPYAGDTVLNNDCLAATTGGTCAPADRLSNATVASTTSNGTLVLAIDGTFTYKPNPDFSGTDSFSYSASDGVDSYGATVTLNVSFVNDDPVAGADSYTNNIGSTISVPAPGVLGNDADADGDVLTVTPQSDGNLELSADGSFTYTGGTPGTPIDFSYTASDGTASSTAVVTLNFNEVASLSLNVKEPGAAGASVPAYRWTVEEDRTFHPIPGDYDAESLAQTFHSSYMPVIAQGCVGEGACSCIEYDENDACTVPEASTPFSELALDPLKHYYVTVLPADAMAETNDVSDPVFMPYRMGHTLGGASIPPAAERASNTIEVITNKQPQPYAQISILVFNDSGPTNGGVDLGEVGLGGFQVTLEDAGGRYGASAGQMLQNADGEGLTNSLDCFGGVAQAPGIILSCPDTEANQAAGLVGRVLIKNLFPGKYGIIVTPRQNDEFSPGESAPGVPLPNVPQQWVQTSTIEGTKVIDAWVKAGEPPFFTEFGPVGVHAFVGFVSPEPLEAAREAQASQAPSGTTTISGAITNHHMSRPPNQKLWGAEEGNTYEALAHTRPWVGLNTVGGRGPNIAAVQATINDDGEAIFAIPHVPLGFDYQIVVWDSYLDQVIAYRSVTAADLALNSNVGNIPVFQWFARLENHVFLDENRNGMLDDGEAPIPEQGVTLRWRDGTVYQSFPTDLEGFVPFDQIFPFFNWLVAEVDYARFEATGLTVTVDHGGDTRDSGNVLNPQVQADGALSRTETGQVLTQGFQGFLGQTSVFEWGKRPYEPGVNGGISGIVYYGVTRAEADPRLAAAEPWEPGIAGVPVRLYREVNTSEIDPDTGEFVTALALVQETTTDSWDDSLPTGCPGAAPIDEQIVGGPVDPDTGVTTKCYDGLRNFNQARPAVFDGGYAFNDIPAGAYVVEVVVPQGYELMKEEDVNVGFGDGYSAESVTLLDGAVPIVPDAAMVQAAGAEADVGIAQPVCVGADRVVPLEMSLFPQANEQAPFAGSIRPLCDRKRVILSDQGQAAADFTLMTDAPIATHFAGMILDDVAQEFNPLSPQFGEKWAPPFVPVSIRDYNGEEISRVYSDQWGRINGLMPSTFTANMPSPSGFSPAMHMTCMNDPGPILLPDGTLGVDPQYNPAYSNFCYTFQYMPGTTTYLDTPVVPVSAFASGYNPPDCSLDAGTPMIYSVDGDRDAGIGPMVSRAQLNGTTGRRGEITITSMGTVVVPNPAYEGPLNLAAGDKTIERDFGFGARGPNSRVTIGGRNVGIRSWDNDTIVVRVRDNTRTGQLVVTRDNGNVTEHAITVTVYNGPDDIPNHTFVSSGQSIQAAIDNATRQGGEYPLIMVEPGVYNESVIMWKPVRLQGAGAGSTMINAAKRPTQVLVDWRNKMDEVFFEVSQAEAVDSLPNQAEGAAGFTVSEGAAITVLGRDTSGNRGFGRNDSRVDGFSITGGDVGGGILVNSYAHGLEISNNHVYGNNGSYHGGIRVGQPFLELPPPTKEPGENNSTYELNTDLNIHNNAVTQNGGLGGAGGGISLSSGSDRYTVDENFVCGNFTTGDGGGIGHLGLSDDGRILSNTIVHNQSFNQAVTVSGGGVFIGGEPVIREFLELDNPDRLSTGSGDVLVRFNRIQGNQAGAGHGGGIRTQFVNGQDIGITGDRPKWYSLRIFDNQIVNNVAGWSGGGISLHNTVKGLIRRNTIAHNDSTATVGGLIINDQSAKQPAGVSTESHSIALANAISIYDGNNSDREFSTPAMSDNILWENRSFNYEVADVAGTPTAQLSPVLAQATVGACDRGNAVYWDLDARIANWRVDDAGTPGPTTSPDPLVVTTTYCNGGRTLATEPGPMFALPALDEGGNAWIDVRFGPLIRDPAWTYEEVPAP